MVSQSMKSPMEERMNAEPFALFGLFFAAGTASVARGDPYPLEFMGALAAGGFVALLFSLWKSRQRKADGIDTALWAMIALVGTMALGFFIAPGMADKTIPLIGFEMTRESAAFLIVLGGTPFIEWMLTGKPFELVRTKIEEALGKKGAT